MMLDYEEIAKAFAKLDYLLTDMGEYFEEIVENMCYEVGIDIGDSWDLTDEELKDCLKEAYRILLERHDSLIDAEIIYIQDRFFHLQDLICLESENYMITESEVYNALTLIHLYLLETDKSKANTFHSIIMKDIEENFIPMCLGYHIGRTYFCHLDSQLWGTLSNDFGTIGHIITNPEKEMFNSLARYHFVIKKSFNGLNHPHIEPAFCFRGKNNDEVVVDVKLARKGYVTEHSVATVGYIKDLGSFTLKVGDEDNAKIVADYFNEYGTKIKEFANNHTEFLQLLPLNHSCETITEDF